MALTPEDVVNKRFQHVKFRDGYDQDEVDDFLDEVVVELRRLYQENDGLREKLSAAEQRVNELEAGAPAARAVSEDDGSATQAMPVAPAIAPQAPAAAPELTRTPTEFGAATEHETSALVSSGSRAGLSASGDDAHSLISLAQRVHDEHIAEGKAKREQLISEAKVEAENILSEAQKKRDDTLAKLENQKINLEKDIDSLQSFERQYRTRLKSYLNDQLRDLENSGSLAPETLGGTKEARHTL